MKEFRLKIIKRRWIFASLNLIAVFVILMSYLYGQPTPNNQNMNDMLQGFRVGICLGLELIFVKQIRDILKALKSEANLRQLYIKENDERNKLIIQQTGSIGYSIAMFGLLLATIVSSFLNIVVCITFLFSTMFLCVIKGALKLYYHRKY